MQFLRIPVFFMSIVFLFSKVLQVETLVWENWFPLYSCLWFNLKSFSKYWTLGFSKPNELWNSLLYVLYFMIFDFIVGCQVDLALTSQDVYQRLGGFFFDVMMMFVYDLLYSTMVMCLVFFMRCFDLLIVIIFHCSCVKLTCMVWPIWYNLWVFD